MMILDKTHYFETFPFVVFFSDHLGAISSEICENTRLKAFSEIYFFVPRTEFKIETLYCNILRNIENVKQHFVF